jgi:hypothetical protein
LVSSNWQVSTPNAAPSCAGYQIWCNEARSLRQRLLRKIFEMIVDAMAPVLEQLSAPKPGDFVFVVAK